MSPYSGCGSTSSKLEINIEMPTNPEPRRHREVPPTLDEPLAERGERRSRRSGMAELPHTNMPKEYRRPPPLSVNPTTPRTPTAAAPAAGPRDTTRRDDPYPRGPFDDSMRVQPLPEQAAPLRGFAAPVYAPSFSPPFAPSFSPAYAPSYSPAYPPGYAPGPPLPPSQPPFSPAFRDPRAAGPEFGPGWVGQPGGGVGVGAAAAQPEFYIQSPPALPYPSPVPPGGGAGYDAGQPYYARGGEPSPRAPRRRGGDARPEPGGEPRRERSRRRRSQARSVEEERREPLPYPRSPASEEDERERARQRRQAPPADPRGAKKKNRVSFDLQGVQPGDRPADAAPAPRSPGARSRGRRDSASSGSWVAVALDDERIREVAEGLPRYERRPRSPAPYRDAGAGARRSRLSLSLERAPEPEPQPERADLVLDLSSLCAALPAAAAPADGRPSRRSIFIEVFRDDASPRSERGGRGAGDFRDGY
ncbi:hypothetical protein GGS23DRAFT_596065 [Durotheca rogersii]|uniref:uncharacterized protein n=1 Tax=Durotheca rogersii TaxID=419775 RepID=UPI00221ED280|nr:uncharacterized protein GGS23DRAFT_596065 [Durotheca rogersii]KAI5864430.1 hypothetical protein GGS23DRAFT_596065 [Durotheca rogersii]